MKTVAITLFLVALTTALLDKPKFMLSEITQLRNEFRSEGARTLHLPDARKLSVKPWSSKPELSAKGGASARMDRYLKPILPRSLESNDLEAIDPNAGKILKIEKINQKTGQVERVLHLKNGKQKKAEKEARKMRKIIGLTPLHTARHIEKQVVEKAAVAPPRQTLKTRIASLYKDRVHNTLKEHLDKHDPIQQHHQFDHWGTGKGGKTKSHK